MSSTPVGKELATGFEPVSDEAWREAATKGLDPDRPLRTQVEPGLEAEWLYVPSDALAPDPGGLPGRDPFTRGVRAGRPWKIRQDTVTPSRAAANDQVLENLNGGTEEVLVAFDRSARRAYVPGTEEHAAGWGVEGVAISTVDDLEEVLSGVHLDLAAVALDARGCSPAAAALLAAVWRRAGVAPESAAGSFGIDPIGELAATGTLARPPAEEIALAASMAAEVDAEYSPAVLPLAVDTGVYAAAGAGAIAELAIALATGVEYLRAGERVGLAPERAARRIEFTLAVGPDQFLEIAKFRAARRLWARVLEASGVPEAARFSPLYGRTSERMWTALDPWTNMLRGTSAAFAAGLGGADGVTVAAFDADYVDWPGRSSKSTEGDGTDGNGDEVAREQTGSAGPGWLGRRIARNTQIVLREESGLGRLADPAAGSWYVESLTDELARAAWERFREFERTGGILEALTEGRLSAELAEAAAGRRSELAHRRRLMTGVNVFPLLGGDRVAVEEFDRRTPARHDAERLATVAEPDGAEELSRLADRAGDAGGILAAATSIAESGARIDQIAAALSGERFTVERPATARDAEPFERLRAAVVDQVAAGGEPPRILLACIGPIARHVGAANWAKSFFESAGIEALNSVTVAADGQDPAAAAAAAADDPESAVPGPSELGPILVRSGASIAAICAGRAETPESILEAISTLREGGAEYVYLADPTPEQADAAGPASGSEARAKTAADEIVCDGVDMVARLTAALALLGVEGASEDPDAERSDREPRR